MDRTLYGTALMNHEACLTLLGAAAAPALLHPLAPHTCPVTPTPGRHLHQHLHRRSGSAGSRVLLGLSGSSASGGGPAAAAAAVAGSHASQHHMHYQHAAGQQPAAGQGVGAWLTGLLSSCCSGGAGVSGCIMGVVQYLAGSCSQAVGRVYQQRLLVVGLLVAVLLMLQTVLLWRVLVVLGQLADLLGGMGHVDAADALKSAGVLGSMGMGS